jgi:hypothetical protein
MGKTLIVTIFTAFMQTLLDGVSSLSDLYQLTPKIPKSCIGFYFETRHNYNDLTLGLYDWSSSL